MRATLYSGRYGKQRRGPAKVRQRQLCALLPVAHPPMALRTGRARRPLCFLHLRTCKTFSRDGLAQTGPAGDQGVQAGRARGLAEPGSRAGWAESVRARAERARLRERRREMLLQTKMRDDDSKAERNARTDLLSLLPARTVLPSPPSRGCPANVHVRSTGALGRSCRCCCRCRCRCRRAVLM